MMTEAVYLERMIPFCNYLKKQIRHAGNGLMYYGTGEAGHWAIQSNFNVAGALAVLATTKQEIPLDKQELLDLALSLFRYNLHSQRRQGILRQSLGRQLDLHPRIGTDGAGTTGV